MSKKLAIFLFALMLSSVSGSVANAASASLQGWAWSDTFGWISFNSSDTDNSTGSPVGGTYNVSVDTTTGNMSGYAWSEYLGWISFNYSDFPACGGSMQPKVDLNTGVVQGYAYAVVYSTTGYPLDGCIELAGANHASVTGGSQGVFFDTALKRFSGYAWAGDTNTDSGPGWIDFKVDSFTNVICTNCTSGGGGITGTCTTASPTQNVPTGSTVIFTATPTTGTQPYTYSWSGRAFDNLASESITYNSTGFPTLIIKDSTGATASPTCPTVTVQGSTGNSTLTIGKTVATANATSLTIKKNSPFAIKWDIRLSNDYSCAKTYTNGAGGAVAEPAWAPYWNGSFTPSNSGNTGTNLVSSSNAGIFKFKLHCTSSADPAGPVTDYSVDLKVNASSESEI